jgi:CheY-like chemotaxis protein
MPKMDGVEATKIIRTQLGCKTPIIALTANAFKHDIDVYLSVGMNDFLIKPYKEEALYSKIDISLRSEKNSSINALANNDLNSNTAMSNRITEVAIPDEIKPKLYNLDQLNMIGRGDEQFLKMMLEMFVKLATQTIDQMEVAYQNKDVDAIKKLAHKIKPSIDNLGIETLYDKIRLLEVYDIEKNSFNDLKTEMDEVIKILNNVVDDIK